ncbi:MAG: sigma-54-dependent Fis family transcriptional regulator [Deltaproteobacteria bacterium]|nr:sigma-54-dependent Fis family transcriptional regulator [Deltaproteobacteria bacterium]MBM4323880.1 sigma-54-dependent Fis family transcriptional regulator [Deltaproteobacteria bacterium]
MNILLVDDEPDVRKSLSNFLHKLGHTITCAANGLEALQEFHSRDYELIITDIRMPGMDGLELMRRIKQVERSSVDILIITGHGDIDNAVKALKYGAYDYLHKPVNVRELAITLERASEYRTLRANYNRLKKEFQEQVEQETQAFRGRADQLREAYLEEIGLGDVYVYSEAMRRVMDLAEKYSSDRFVPILIEGETGTGKELVARYIHYYEKGKALTPFVAINCGGIPSELFEVELFGHEGGAYTGATLTGRMGKFEMARGGTIFLDEIGELPANLQVKFLRVIEDKKLFRVGGIKEIPIDVRIISATNKNLSQEVAKKRFREDLYYRINMGTIRIPPLRDRREDILPMALRFVRRSFSRTGKTFNEFTTDAQEFLRSYSWPGNVRQLRNAMERLALLGPWDRIHRQDLSFIHDSPPMDERLNPFKPVLGQSEFELPPTTLNLEHLTNEIIKRALEKSRGNQTQTAQYLGLSRRVLQGKLKKMNLL